jgi:hypothetical protein
MKKLIAILFLFAFSTANAQEVFKTVPNSLITIDYSSYQIDGVSGKVVDMDLTLKDSMAYTTYIRFYRLNLEGNFVEIPRADMNADRIDFEKGVRASVPSGTSDSVVNTQVNNVMKAMLTASPSGKWAAFNSILMGYGASLKPLNEQ